MGKLKMRYVYETHLHTIEVSACSRTPAADYIEYMKALGYSGIIVTDHFFNGNCAVPKDLPWEKRVELYMKGYEHAKEAADDGFAVLFGVEYNFQGDEYLLYGVDGEWLMSNPDIMGKDRHEVYRRVHEAGALMIHAHPYRERDYLSEIHLAPGACDGAEVYNASNPDWQNALGYQFAETQNLRMAAGSDIHNFTLDDMGGMSFPYPIKSIEDYVEAFLAGDGVPVYKRNAKDQEAEFLPVSENIFLTRPLEEPTLEVFWH